MYISPPKADGMIGFHTSVRIKLPQSNVKSKKKFFDEFFLRKSE